MLVIRQTQLHALATPRLRTFEPLVEEHLREFFPDEVQQMGNERLRSFVARSIQRAFALGVDALAAMCKFANMELIFGEDFLNNPTHTWAQTIWKLQTEEPNQRINTLTQAAIAFLRGDDTDD